MSCKMEEASSSSRRPRGEEPEFSLRDWGLKSSRIISSSSSRDNTMSRRFSASFIRREDTFTSFRSNFTISSTASSPGYTLREEIDPATYSFTTALKALQARTVYSWECRSPEGGGGFALNHKWTEAEKYISNPLSGQVPVECLSAKTLSGRSFRNLTSRITMSAPLLYPPNLDHHYSTSTTFSKLTQTNPSTTITLDDHFPIQEKKVWSMNKRDVGTQSTPLEMSSSSPSPATTPSLEERSIQRGETETEDSPVSDVANVIINFQQQDEVKETREREGTKEEEEVVMRKKGNQKFRCSNSNGGCLSLSFRNLWRRKKQLQTDNIIINNNNNNKQKSILVLNSNNKQQRNIFPCNSNGC